MKRSSVGVFTSWRAAITAIALALLLSAVLVLLLLSIGEVLGRTVVVTALASFIAGAWVARSLGG